MKLGGLVFGSHDPTLTFRMCALHAAVDIPRTVQEGRGAFGGYAVVSPMFDS
jgi:hypothetical protein